MIVESESQITRVLVMNVTRLAGLFGDTIVSYRISGGIDEVMDIREILRGQDEGTLTFREGQTFSTISVPISSQVRISMLLQRQTNSFKIKYTSVQHLFFNTFFLPFPL